MTEDSNDAFQQAGDWRVRRARGLSPVEAERFRLWHAEPANADAYERVARSWAAFEGAVFQGGGAESLALASMRARALKRGRAPSRRAVFAQIAASVAVVAVAAGGYGLVAPVLGKQTYSAETGQIRDVLLEDGSRLTLDAGAVVEVRIKPGSRDLTLVQGRARFAVAHDASRPMQVDVGSGLVTVLGTTFNIDRRADSAIITLIEGAIAASAKGAWPGSPLPAGVRLRAGQQVTIGSAGPGAIRAVDTLGATVWRDRKLDFGDASLGEAVARVNRYADIPVVLAEPGLASLRISGSFDHGDARGFADGVGKLYGLEPVVADDRIVMRRARRPD